MVAAPTRSKSCFFPMGESNFATRRCRESSTPRLWGSKTPQGCSGCKWLSTKPTSLSIDISPESVFLTASPVYGTVPAFTTLGVNATFHSLSLPFGTYNATITTSHDAPLVVGPHVTSATFEVINTPSVVAMTSPVSGTVILQGSNVQLAATATDAEGVQKVEFYRGSEKVGEDSWQPYEATWYGPPSGTHLITARVLDSLGGVTVSAPTTVTVLPNSDADGMDDDWELQNGLDPALDDARLDLDGDGLTNIWEYTWKFDPTNPADAQRDSDADGLPDWWELIHYGNASVAIPSADPDSDGLTNLQEFQNATNPKNWDTDGDLLPDEWEVQYGLDPLSSSGINGADGDQDGDGLSNFQEMIHGSNPGAADTDGDGVNDGGEVNQGSNPNDPGDGGQPPPADELVEVPFTVGDPSGSHSERWKMNIQANGPDDTRQFGFVSPDFGEMGTQSFMLRKGNSYTITITHVATNMEEGGPDYDWEAKARDMPSGDGDQEQNHYFVVGNAWVVDNSQGLLPRRSMATMRTSSKVGRHGFTL